MCPQMFPRDRCATPQTVALMSRLAVRQDCRAAYIIECENFADGAAVKVE